MSQNEPEPRASLCDSPKENALWTRNRRELLEWLGRNAPSLAELYEGAVSLLYGSQIPGFSRFISHAVREVRNRLPGVISGTISTGRLDYKGRMDQIANAAKKAVVNLEGKGKGKEDSGSSVDAVPPQIAVPRKLAEKFGRLIQESRRRAHCDTLNGSV